MFLEMVAWNLWFMNLSAKVSVFIFNIKISSNYVTIMTYKILAYSVRNDLNFVQTIAKAGV